MKVKGRNPINQFNPTVFLCLSQARFFVSNAMLWVVLVFKSVEVRVVFLFVDFSDHTCLNSLIIVRVLTSKYPFKELIHVQNCTL